MNRIMKDSGVEWIGEIPEHWKISTLGRVATLYTGNSIKDEEKTLFENPENAIPYISTKDITAFNGLTSYDNGLYIPKDNNNFKKAFEGNILICIEGGSAGKKKTQLSQNVAFVNKLCCISSKSINNRYLYLYTLGKNFEDYFQTQLTGIIGGVSINNLKKFSIPIPSLHEQQKITDFLDEKTSQIDTIIEKTKQSIVEFKKYKQALITEIVTKGLNPDVKTKDSGVEWIGEIPEHWDVVKLGRLIISTMNGITRRNNTNENVGSVVLRLKDIGNDGIVYDNVNRIELSKDEKDKYALKYGDLLFVRVNGSKHLVGKNTLFIGYPEIVAFNDHIIKVTFSEKIMSTFTKWYLQSMSGRQEVQRYIKTSAGQFTISGEDLRKVKIGLPPLIEQQQITDYLDEKCAHIDSLIADKEKLIGEFETYKKALIFEYITGKKEVE